MKETTVFLVQLGNINLPGQSSHADSMLEIALPKFWFLRCWGHSDEPSCAGDGTCRCERSRRLDRTVGFSSLQVWKRCSSSCRSPLW